MACLTNDWGGLCCLCTLGVGTRASWPPARAAFEREHCACRIEREQMEEAFTLMLTHKVCGVRSSAVMQLLDGSVFSKDRIDIPVEEAVGHATHSGPYLVACWA